MHRAGVVADAVILRADCQPVSRCIERNTHAELGATEVVDMDVFADAVAGTDDGFLRAITEGTVAEAK